MSTTKEVILQGLSVDGDKVIPNRTEEQMKQELADRGILEQEYKARTEGSYKVTRPEDMITSGREEEEEEEAAQSDKDALDGIRHTDGFLCDGVFHNCTAAKVTTAVLDSLKEAQYVMLKYSVKFKRTDSDTIEAAIPEFVKDPMDIPRGTVSLIIEGKYVAVEPQVNGFSLACLIENVSEDQHKMLRELELFITKLQGYLLELTLKSLHSAGVPIEELVKSQLAVGVVPQARRLYERKLAEVARKEANEEKIVITEDIRTQSALVADELNSSLGLLPLTGQSVEFGLSLKKITKTVDEEVIRSWTSKRAGISYFTQGDTNGRIEILSQSVRSIPLTSEITPEAVKILKELMPTVIDIFENVARDQLGNLPMVRTKAFPGSKDKNDNNGNKYAPSSKDVTTLFDFDKVTAYKLKVAITRKAQDHITQKIDKEAQSKETSLMEKYLRLKSKTAQPEENK